MVLGPDDSAGQELPRGVTRARLKIRFSEHEQRHRDQELGVGGEIREEIGSDGPAPGRAAAQGKQRNGQPGQEHHYHAALEHLKPAVFRDTCPRKTRFSRSPANSENGTVACGTGDDVMLGFGQS